MTKRSVVSLCFALAAITAASAQQTPPLTPAGLEIHKAQDEITKTPKHYPYYNHLAMAYARRERETGDAAYYNKAEETLQKSFALEPGNFEGLKVKTYLLLGSHEYAKAFEIARKLNKQTPDDVAVYGYVADAAIGLGNYKEAVESTQWMLNLRPGNIPGLIRAGQLRELHGDLDGATEVFQMAYDATPFQESEDRAWLLTQMAQVKLMRGDLKSAETLANNALGLFPDYHFAIGALGQIRMAQQRYAEAAALFEKRFTDAPRAENLFAAGEALYRAGKKDEALKTFAEFEDLALKESASSDNANLELIEYYIDYSKQPAKALDLAGKQAALTHDIYTLDSYAWSLAASGDYVQAQTQMQKALATGIKDPRILEHAAAIARHVPTVAEGR